jgi:adenylate cyclase
MGYLLRGPIAVVATLSLGAAHWASAQLLFNHYELWIPYVIPLMLQIPLALSIGLLLQYLTARRAIGHYVPEPVAEQLVQEGAPSPTPKLSYGTCLSTDAQEYTKLSEMLAPQDLASLMNEYFSTLGDPVVRHQGEILDFTGDSMMCVWAAAQGEWEIRMKACLAALEIIEAVDRFNHRHLEHQLPTRVGLHAGEVALGHMGGSGHFAYHVVGDIANTASRVENLNKYLGTRILTSEAVVGGIEGLLLRPLGTFRLVGKTKALPILEIVGQRDNADQAEKELCGRFAAAMKAYEAANWSEAVGMFEQILSDHPTDGPSRFFLRLCQKYSSESYLPSDWPVIALESK